MLQSAWQNRLATESAADAPQPPPHAECVAFVPSLGVAAFDGADVRRFLQGYLTCDALSLDATRFQPAALCNLKGRVVVNGWVIAPGAERVLMVIDASMFAALESLLGIYLRFSKTRLTNRSEDSLVFALWGAPASPAGLPIDAYRRLRIVEDLASAEALWGRVPHAGADAWDAELISAGMPLVSAATSDAFLPQMLDLPALGAVDFAKGCYLGQEVVARAQHRGQVKRHLVRLAWRGGTVPSPGAALADTAGRARAIVVQRTRGPDAGTALAVVQDGSSYPLLCGDTRLDRLG